jgi:phosphatidylcholine synthase
MTQYSLGQRLGAWSVHIFTSSGIVAGFFAIVAISENRFTWAFFWLLIALIIDGIDGTFARIFRVGEVLPDMSGKTIDYVVDFCNYAVVPTYLLYAAKLNTGEYLLPDDLRLLSAALILLVSAVYYGKEGMVSNDYYFIGFPVMWNLVAFYLYYITNLSPALNFATVVLFSILHFVPLKYLYPSRTRKFRVGNILATVACLLSCIALPFLLEYQPDKLILIFILRLVALISLAYFGFLTIYHTYFDADTKEI